LGPWGQQSAPAGIVAGTDCRLLHDKRGRRLLGATLQLGAHSAQPPCSISSGAEINYGPGEDLEIIDIALVREAGKQIDMAAFVLTESAVI